MRYSQELRDHILKRVLPPQSDSIERVAREEGISEQTIRNWKAQAISENYTPSGNDEPEKWSSQDKFLIVLETSGMSETDLAEYARQKGLYVEQIAEWRDACINANGGKIVGDLEGNRRRLTSAQNLPGNRNIIDSHSPCWDTEARKERMPCPLIALPSEPNFFGVYEKTTVIMSIRQDSLKNCFQEFRRKFLFSHARADSAKP